MPMPAALAKAMKEKMMKGKKGPAAKGKKGAAAKKGYMKKGKK